MIAATNRDLAAEQAGSPAQATFAGFTDFCASAASEKHAGYLRRLGFEELAGKPGTFRKKI